MSIFDFLFVECDFVERCRDGVAHAAGLQFVLPVRIRRRGATSLPPKVLPTC